MLILSANLREGLADPSALRHLLESRDIDIACFQELGPDQAEAAAEVLPHGFLEPGWGRTRYHGMGIAARHPIEVHTLPLDGRRALRSELDSGCWPRLDHPLELLNVHVLVPVARSMPRTPLTRRRQVRQLLEHLDAAPEQRRLLVGDLNSNRYWPAYTALTSRLRDLHSEHARACGAPPPATWGPRPGGRRWLRLDHALGRGVDRARVEVVPVEGSDHSGLLVEI
jgi:endonuclease/exonuclease/phosphatase family metal-dependent hydrolase